MLCRWQARSFQGGQSTRQQLKMSYPPTVQQKVLGPFNYRFFLSRRLFDMPPAGGIGPRSPGCPPHRVSIAFVSATVVRKRREAGETARTPQNTL